MTDLVAICTVCHTATTDVRRYRVQRESAVRAVRLLALCADCREPVEALLGIPAANRRLPATAGGGVRPPAGRADRHEAPARTGRHLHLVTT
ncbi:hypothetical protein JL107_00370 [Nakamurella flavida]|uniref:Uncharacterized protein n=1 Tax=Nakamurella flavida TaxID=363630 RepID=A0A938YKC2_9ACTN|nr:hypothetical protein [Nakamurella flavida]MBM9474889.1 hypothetical protein [Nakamurella flavida]MDP9776459.1 hypothetical protein [Nakamurella flavida]